MAHRGRDGRSASYRTPEGSGATHRLVPNAMAAVLQLRALAGVNLKFTFPVVERPDWPHCPASS
jgi:hypothetical protein